MTDAVRHLDVEPELGVCDERHGHGSVEILSRVDKTAELEMIRYAA